MTRRTRQSAQSVSLFPFLAVLVCAMGVLIFLLIVTTSRIRSESLARAAAELERQLAPPAIAAPPAPQPAAPLPAPPEPEPVTQAAPVPVLPEVQPNDPVPPEIVQTVRWPDPDEPLREQIARLTQERDALRKQEQQLAARLGSAKELAKQEQARLASRQQTMKTESGEAAVQAAVVTTLEQQQRKLELEIRRLGREIEETRARAASQPSRFSLVAYDGASGTTRRPILIECTGEGIRFLPEDVMITEEDLIGFTEGYNPVLAGAKSLTEYWLQHDTAADGKPPAHPPYVLLLVRQSGSLSYYVTRRLLDGLGQPYGYELLPDDFPLEPPAVDPRAQEVCRTAVSRLLDERQELLARLSEKYGAGGQVRVSRNGFDLVELQESAASGKQLAGGRTDSETAGESVAKGGTAQSDIASAISSGTATGTDPATSGTDGSQKPDSAGSGQLAATRTSRASGPASPRRTTTSRAGTSGTVESGNPEPDLAGLFGKAGSEPGEPAGSQPTAATFGDSLRGERGTSGTGSEAKTETASGTAGSGTGTPDPGTLFSSSAAAAGDSTGLTASPEASNEGLASGGRQAARTDGNTQTGTGALSESLFGTAETGSAESRPTAAEAGPAGSLNQTPGDLPAGSTTGSPESLADAFQLPRGGSAAELRNMEFAERGGTTGRSTSGTARNTFGRPQSASSSTSSQMSGQTSGSAASGSSTSGSTGSSAASPFQSSGGQSRSRSRGGVEFPDFGAAMRRRGIGYERELTVALQADQALIGGTIRLRLGRGETATELSAEVLRALEQKVASWGEPPEGFYWVPRLRVQISPGGNLHYSRLREDIARWGLETSVEQKLEAIPDPAASPGSNAGRSPASGIFSDR